MAGVAGAAVAGRADFGCSFMWTSHPLRSFLLANNVRNAFFSSPCAIWASVSARSYGLLAAARSSLETGQGASVAVPRAAIVSAQEEVREGESVAVSSFGVTWAQTALQGQRSEMEDDIVVRGDGLNGFTYAAVFDGHAGLSSVKFLRDELYKDCAAALHSGLLLESNDFDVTKNAIVQAFLQADRRLLSWLEETQEELESGSTATVMFLKSDRLIVAHVGDSQAIICRHGKAEFLTEVHRPFGYNNAAFSEIKRIKDAGGWISNGRVCGILAVSRAFGDVKLKSQRQEFLAEGVAKGYWPGKFVSRIEFNGDWITAAPYVNQMNMNDAEFVILASDGLWDSISSSEAVYIVRHQLHEHGDTQRACEALANAALDRNSQDNISIVIADLGRVTQQNGHLEETNAGSEFGQAMLTIGIIVLGAWLSQFARNWAF